MEKLDKTLIFNFDASDFQKYLRNDSISQLIVYAFSPDFFQLIVGGFFGFYWWITKEGRKDWSAFLGRRT